MANYSCTLGKEHTDFAEAKLQKRLIEGVLEPQQVDQLSVIAMAGGPRAARRWAAGAAHVPMWRGPWPSGMRSGHPRQRALLLWCPGLPRPHRASLLLCLIQVPPPRR